MPTRRTATYVKTLVYADGPQLLQLMAYKTNIVAMAIPSDTDKLMFVATSVTQKNWNDYLDGLVDLRYLFVHANVRTAYKFDLMKLRDGKISMAPWEGPLTEDVLPSPRFFSSNHTEPDDEGPQDQDSEVLYVDGEWDMPDFGKFYSRYADVYYFLSSANEYEDADTPAKLKDGIADAFRDKAFKGGFSYVHFFEALASNRGRNQRLGVDEIQYASPGHINVNGEREAFEEAKAAINNFLAVKKDARALYTNLYAFMSKSRLLQMSGDDYVATPMYSDYIHLRGTELANLLGVPNLDAIETLVEDNKLVFVKIILSFYRRLDEVSNFFAQGRVNFS